MYTVTAKTKQKHPQSHFYLVIGHERQGSTFSLTTMFVDFDAEANELSTEPYKGSHVNDRCRSIVKQLKGSLQEGTKLHFSKC